MEHLTPYQYIDACNISAHTITVHVRALVEQVIIQNYVPYLFSLVIVDFIVAWVDFILRIGITS